MAAVGRDTGREIWLLRRGKERPARLLACQGGEATDVTEPRTAQVLEAGQPRQGCQIRDPGAVVNNQGRLSGLCQLVRVGLQIFKQQLPTKVLRAESGVRLETLLPLRSRDSREVSDVSGERHWTSALLQVSGREWRGGSVSGGQVAGGEWPDVDRGSGGWFRVC